MKMEVAITKELINIKNKYENYKRTLIVRVAAFWKQEHIFTVSNGDVFRKCNINLRKQF